MHVRSHCSGQVNGVHTRDFGLVSTEAALSSIKMNDASLEYAFCSMVELDKATRSRKSETS